MGERNGKNEKKKQGQCNHPHLSLDANIFCVKASIALCVHKKICCTAPKQITGY